MLEKLLQKKKRLLKELDKVSEQIAIEKIQYVLSGSKKTHRKTIFKYAN